MGHGGKRPVGNKERTNDLEKTKTAHGDSKNSCEKYESALLAWLKSWRQCLVIAISA